MKKKIRKEHVKDLERFLFLAEHHRILSQQAQQSAAGLLKVAYGIDIAGQDWTLDLEKGIVTRQEPENEQ